MARMLVAFALAFSATQCAVASRRLSARKRLAGKLRDEIDDGRWNDLGELSEPFSVLDTTMAALKMGWKDNVDTEVLKDIVFIKYAALGILPSIAGMVHPALGLLGSFLAGLFEGTSSDSNLKFVGKLLDQMELLIDMALYEQKKQDISGFINDITLGISRCCEANPNYARQRLTGYQIQLETARSKIFGQCNTGGSGCSAWRTSAGGASTLLYELVYVETRMLVVGEVKALSIGLGDSTSSLEQNMTYIVKYDGQLLSDHYNAFKTYRLSNERFTDPRMRIETINLGWGFVLLNYSYQAGLDNYLGKTVGGSSLCRPNIGAETCRLGTNCTEDFEKKFNYGVDNWSGCLRNYKANIERNLKGTFDSRITHIQNFLK